MARTAVKTTPSKSTNEKKKPSSSSKALTASRKTNDRFCLGRIQTKNEWLYDEPNCTQTLAAWQPSVHSLAKVSFNKIKAHLKEPKEDRIDQERTIIIPRSYVKCGKGEFEVASFKLNEEQKEIEISWPPTPSGQVVELIRPVSPSPPSSTHRPASLRVLRAAVPPAAPTGNQFSDGPNPYGRFIYWQQKPAEPPAPTREELGRRVQRLEEQMREQQDMISRLQDELELLRRERQQ